MSGTDTMLSVGIDVGTSTTQLVFSRLTVENIANVFSIPRITIVDKQIRCSIRGPSTQTH